MTLKNKSTLLTTALLLAGCQLEIDPQLENRQYSSSTHPTAVNYSVAQPYNGIYRHLVHVETPNPKLKRQLETLTNYSSNLTAGEKEFSHLRLTIIPEKELKGIAARPHIFGVLKPTTYPSSLSVNYTLTDKAGTTLDQGQIIGVGPERTVISPGEAPALKKDPAAMAEVTAQLMKILLKNSQTTPWDITVVDRSPDGMHLTVNASTNIGLKIGHSFVAEEKPKVELEVVAFETTEAGGQGRAMLKLKSGVLPHVGSKLIPLN